MPWLELSITCDRASQPRWEAALETLGALAVTLMDADADGPDEQAILEPGVGEMPLWASLRLSALFPGDTVPALLLTALGQVDDALDPTCVQWREVADQDWERVWLDQYQPLHFGRRTFIVPCNHELPAAARAADAAVVRLDPGLAFGSGTHPTTALCLQWLDAIDVRGQSVLDFGCGSGILALAALKLGAARAVAIDNDAQALLATRANAERNAVGERLAVYAPEQAPVQTYPVVLANILASALARLAPQLAVTCAPGGHLALSGILRGQEEELLSIYRAWFADFAVASEGDWLRITARRR